MQAAELPAGVAAEWDTWLPRYGPCVCMQHARQPAPATLLLACIPLRLRVLARGEMSAERPFLVRAPLGGVIDRIDVQPNQRVTAGMPLFSLDVTVPAGQNALANTAHEATLEAFRQSSQLAVTNDRGKLEAWTLASSFGGPIPTQRREQDLVPMQATFRVRLDACNRMASPAQELSGVVRLQGEQP